MSINTPLTVQKKKQSYTIPQFISQVIFFINKIETRVSLLLSRDAFNTCVLLATNGRKLTRCLNGVNALTSNLEANISG